MKITEDQLRAEWEKYTGGEVKTTNGFTVKDYAKAGNLPYKTAAEQVEKLVASGQFECIGVRPSYGKAKAYTIKK